MTSPDEPGAATPARAAPAPAAAGRPASPAPAPIPTGFPEPVTPDEPRSPAADGRIRLAPVGFAELIVPPLEAGGESFTITADGTDVDEETAERAREAARLAGFSLRQL